MDDLNLLVALDALLAENSVTAAAARLRTSPPAMSRTLGRLRRVLDDPVLVRAGRNLVPTPKALSLRTEVHALVEQARGLFEPAADEDLSRVSRTLNLQAADALVAGLAPGLIERARRDAPGITLRFRPESLEDGPGLRDGAVDLEVGVIDRPEPEIRVERLARVRLVGLVRSGHPLLDGPVTAERFAAADHVVVSRRGRTRGPIDDRLAELGLTRRVVAVVPGYTASLLMARDCDVVCLGFGGLDRPAGEDVPDPPPPLGLRAVEIPVGLPPLELGMAWHPRNSADRAHGWLRDQVRDCLTR